MSYINVESTRVLLYTLFFLDSQTFTSCNARPLMSPMEFGWELPFPSSLWEAKNSQVWLQRVNEHFGYSTITMATDLLHGPRGPATTSLSIATQQLMTEAPSSELLAALEASPFAAFWRSCEFGCSGKGFHAVLLGRCLRRRLLLCWA